MQFQTKRSLRLIGLALLLVVLATSTLLAYTYQAHAAASHVNTSASSLPTVPNVNIHLNKQKKVVFSRKALSCHAQVSCLNITNKTKQTIDLYLNGKFLFSMLPGNITGTNFNFPGRDTFTIPNANPNAILPVTVQP